MVSGTVSLSTEGLFNTATRPVVSQTVVVQKYTLSAQPEQRRPTRETAS
jgi:hypothetical protein